MSNNREFGIVVYGATGYTGKLVCEYLNTQYGANGEIKWAMAGRSQAKLEAVRNELGIDSDLPLLVADAANPASIDEMVSRTGVVLTTVGPYQLYGNELVAACAKAGTDYVDLCGEPVWMKDMISKHQATAQQSGARIVFSCGFDSIPFDLGVHFLQRHAKENFGHTLSRVKGRVRALKGTWSGGTLASFKATMVAAKTQPEVFAALIDSFALCEGNSGAQQPTGAEPIYEEDLKSWSAPFVMASINTKNVHRSNFVQGKPYGEHFVYDEMLLTGDGEQGEAAAKFVAEDKSMAEDQTQPGEGPSKEERDSGFYDLLFVGSDEHGHGLTVNVKGDKDPGYGSTSKMISEAAVCLLKNPQLASGGFWTPASAMGDQLIERLQANAGLSFKVLS